MKCIKGHEITVHKTPAGWYIGCFGEDGPICRISTYYRTKEAAEKALKNKTFFPDEGCVLCPGVWECIPEEDEEPNYEAASNEELIDDLILCNRDAYYDDIWRAAIEEIAKRLGVTKKLNF